MFQQLSILNNIEGDADKFYGWAKGATHSLVKDAHAVGKYIDLAGQECGLDPLCTKLVNAVTNEGINY